MEFCVLKMTATHKKKIDNIIAVYDLLQTSSLLMLTFKKLLSISKLILLHLNPNKVFHRWKKKKKKRWNQTNKTIVTKIAHNHTQTKNTQLCFDNYKNETDSNFILMNTISFQQWYD